MLLQRSFSPIVITSIFCHLYNKVGGVSKGAGREQTHMGELPSNRSQMDAESQGTVSGRKNGNNEESVIRSNEEE